MSILNFFRSNSKKQIEVTEALYLNENWEILFVLLVAKVTKE